MIRKNLYLPVFLLIALCVQSGLAQDTELVLSQAEKARLGPLVGVSSQPVIYGSKNDNLPGKIKARGVIEEVSFVPFACGVICWSGTAKIKLLDKIKGYKPAYLYITVFCFTGKEEDFLNKPVKIKASKLKKERTPGCEGIVNSIDSHGTAFYRLDKNQSLK